MVGHHGFISSLYLPISRQMTIVPFLSILTGRQSEAFMNEEKYANDEIAG